MKNKLIKLTIATALFVCGAGLAVSHHQTATPVEAASHADNFDPYYYEGTYYDNLDDTGAEGLNGSFRKALGSYIFPKGWYTYGGQGSDHLATQLQYADEDPTNSSNMIYLYTRDSVKKNSASSWNREHCWPQANSNDHWGQGNAGTDLLHIRPTYNSTNSKRGNDKYGNTNKTGAVTYNGIPYGYSSGKYFEPLDSVKGDVARIIMYVWTAYYDYYNDTNLKITNAFASYDTLLEWHMLDKPDVMEGHRNNYCQTSKQKNRNPFVDHPEYAWKVFGDSASSSVKQQCMDVYPGNSVRATNITLSGEPTKKAYVSGEAFDPTGLTVTATFSDNTTSVIANNKCVWEPTRLRTGQPSVTCKYSGLTATYEGITVTPAPAPVPQGTYGICFRSEIDDTSFPVATNEILSKCAVTNTLVDSVTDSKNVYASELGILIDNQGSVTFKLKDIAKTPDIETIYFVSQPGTKETSVDVKLNEEDVGFDSTDDTHAIHIAGYFDEGISTVTITTPYAFTLVEFGIYVREKVQPEPPISSSSTLPPTSEVSSEPESQPSSSSSNPGDNKKNTGCNGSIIAVASLTGISALIGSVLLLSKKRKK